MGVAAFVNMRWRERHHNDNRVLFFFDGMRVRESLRGNGVGTLTLSAAMHAISSTYRMSNNHKTRIALLSVTNPHNKAMREVFHKLRWTSHEVMHVWPTPDIVLDAKRRNMRLMEVFDESNSITAPLREFSKQWTAVFTEGQILTAMKLLQQQGASYQRPLYYDVESAECASTFLKHKLALAERRSVWRLQIDGQLRGLIFVREIVVEQSEPCKHSLLSACVVDAQAAESCIVFATEHLALDVFNVVYDTPIRSHHISQSKLLSRVPSEPFVIYRHDGSQCDKVGVNMECTAVEPQTQRARLIRNDQP
ncbi:hypothetical protein BWQ96_06485 [Gracilariopsis chorda]|uniref:Uncharacterized protein n=1 Tax=Gracilariopsis chorda TaxID=448386 RepID=A0A2V3INW7_9FLOR|nr:hypothetical protein BWQ96_06485 [Gracilariopsis chorda]|eukprot:PXF43753.1 hypothetical protein BWQ96_06485 [Gracilariopsis chorda]